MRIIEQLVLEGKDVLLKDLSAADIDDYRRWVEQETAWQQWDAPWETVDTGFVQKKREMLNRPKPQVRGSLEIYHSNGSHIGWVGSYFLDKERTQLAVGINIAKSSYWGKGLGKQALLLWVQYQIEQRDLLEVYCETWAGNERMIKLVAKCGFRKIERYKNKRQVLGNYYDGLRFVLKRARG